LDEKQWQRKLAKPHGASLLNRKYQKLNSHGALLLTIKWGFSPIAPPFPPPIEKLNKGLIKIIL